MLGMLQQILNELEVNMDKLSGWIKLSIGCIIFGFIFALVKDIFT